MSVFGHHVPEDSEDFVDVHDNDEDALPEDDPSPGHLDGEAVEEDPAVHPEIAKRQAQENAAAEAQGREPVQYAETQLNIEQSVGAPDSGLPVGTLEEIESRGMAERIVLEGVSEDFDADFDSGVNLPGLADDEHPEEGDVEPSQGLIVHESDADDDREG